jgi:DNA-binding transcriptional MerR regulator
MASKLRIRPDRKKWSQQALNDAMKAVFEGQSVKSASNEYGIPRKTLSDYLKRGNGSTKLRTGPSTVFSREQEEELVTRIKRMHKIGFPLTRNDIRRTAYEFALSCNIADRFGKSAAASKLAGKDWFSKFMRRRTDLSARKTEILSYGRGAGLNRTVVNEFYELLLKTN